MKNGFTLTQDAGYLLAMSAHKRHQGRIASMIFEAEDGATYAAGTHRDRLTGYKPGHGLAGERCEYLSADC